MTNGTSQPAPRLWIVEPDLRYPYAHYYSWAVGVAAGAMARGYDVTVLCSDAVDDKIRAQFERLPHRLVPMFATCSPDAPRLVKQAYGTRNYHRAIDFLRRNAWPGDLALTFSGVPHFAAVAATASTLKPLPCPLVMQFFAWDMLARPGRGPDPVHSATVRVARAVVKRLGGPELRLAGQTESIADAVGREVGRPVASLPFPLDWSVLGAPSRTERSPVVGYVGSARRSKGFPAFVDAVTSARPTPAIAAQTFRLPEDPDPEHPARVARLAAAGARIIDHGLIDEGFAEFLHSLDIIVLPYDAALYRERNSSLMAEAVGLGRVVVAPAHTWLGDTLDRHGLGVTYDAANPTGLTRAIEHAVAHHETLRDTAMAAAPAWQRQHSPAGFVDALLTLVGRGDT